MNFNKKYMIFSLVVILLALVANYSFQQSYKQSSKTRRQRKSIYFGKNKIVTNLYLAQAKNPKFLAIVEKKLKQDFHDASKAVIKKRLSSREWLVYAEALGLYSNDQSVKLMKKIYELGGVKTRNRIVKGLGNRVGQANMQFLTELEAKLSQMSELEKVTFYLAKYRQLSRFDEKKYQKELKQIVTRLKDFLSFTHPMVNFSILRFFEQHHIFDSDIEKFSKQVIEAVLKRRQLSPVLLNAAAKILFQTDKKFMISKHRALLTKPQEIFIRYYVTALRTGCFVDLPFVFELLKDDKLSFSIFRPLVAELYFIGGDKILTMFKKLQTYKLSSAKHGVLQKLLSRMKGGPSQMCPELF